MRKHPFQSNENIRKTITQTMSTNKTHLLSVMATMERKASEAATTTVVRNHLCLAKREHVKKQTIRVTAKEEENMQKEAVSR